MDLKEMAEALVAACREGREAELLDTLYAADVVSVEAADQGNGRETVGLDGVRGKHAWWEQTFEVLSADVQGPFLHGDDRFAVIFDVEAKARETGAVSAMKEVAVYHVAEGRITREEFFYG